MTIREYIEKYNLEEKENFPYDDLVEDLKHDFNYLVREYDAMSDMHIFRFCINSIRMKWDIINENALKPLPVFLWKSFYKYVVGIRELVRNYNPEAIRGQREKMIKRGKGY